MESSYLVFELYNHNSLKFLTCVNVHNKNVNVNEYKDTFYY